MKIIIADDSSLWRDRIKGTLIASDCNAMIYEARNGVEALQLIEEMGADLAILDIRMPELNGIEVLIKVRKMKIKIKVCILTSYPYPQYKNKCMAEGADYFLSKTEDFEDLNIFKRLTNA